MRAKILIVEDDANVRLGLANRIAWMGHDSITADNGRDALRLIEEDKPDLVLLDMEHSHLSGLEILQQGRPQTPVEGAPSVCTTPLIIMISLMGFGTTEKAKQAKQLGAFDHLTVPGGADHFSSVINRALSAVELHRQVEELQQDVWNRYDYDQLVGTNPRMAAPLTVAKQVADSNVTVLLLGGTGAERELIARAIHQWSPRRSKPFIAVNCAAWPERLLGAELFGYVRGGFALGDRLICEPGAIEMGEGGTVFLDEIGDMPLPLQGKMLRLLADQTFLRVGGTEAVSARVRLIAATTRDLQKAVDQGIFLGKLYWRLSAITITFPPVGDR
jgi:DNA-binding NtrC family response regulator